MTLTRTDFAYDDCSSQHLRNTSVSTPFNVFQYDEPSVKNVTLFYLCSLYYPITEGYEFACHPPTSYHSYSTNHALWPQDVVDNQKFLDLIENCKTRIQVPVSIETDVEILNGFGVKYKVDESCKKCWDSDGRCGSNDWSTFICYCSDGHHSLNCPDSSWRIVGMRNKVIVGVVSAVVVCGVIGLLFLSTNHCCCKIKSWRQTIGLCKTSKVDQNIESFIRNHGYLALTRYKFGDVKKMTSNFKDKLGQGGYGSVYKGKLLNGHPVAVKLLKASQENGEDFINEVTSISRTSHVNVVTLLGFCFEGKQKALIYEFMPNGSLDMFILNNRDKNNLCLTWEKLYQIAIGIAQGL